MLESINIINQKYIYFLLLVLLPLIIHLIVRRRTRQRYFPSIHFLLSARKKARKSIHLRDFMVLAMRTLLVLGIIFYILKIELTDKEASEGRFIESLFFLIDTSYSMGRKYKDHDLLYEAKKVVGRIVDDLPPDTELFLITSDNPMIPYPADIKDIRHQLEGVHLSFQARNLITPLRVIVDWVVNNPEKKVGVALFTDMQRLSWPSIPEHGISREVTRKINNRMRLLIFDMKGRSKEKGSNTQVISSEVIKEDTGYTIHGRFKYHSVKSSRLKAESSKPPSFKKKVTLTLNGEERAKGLVSFDTKGDAKKFFSLTTSPDDGIIKGILGLEGGDILPHDDKRFFIISEPGIINVLIIEGDPASSPFENISFYMKSALSSKGRLPLFFNTDIKGPSALEESDPQSFDVLILANLSHADIKSPESLSKFVEEGGGLVIIPGDQVVPEEYNASLDFMPGKFLRVRESPESSENSPAISHALWEHPVLNIFRGEGRGDFSHIRVKRYMEFITSLKANPGVLLGLKDGTPFMVEGSSGRGKVLILTSSLKRSWCDIAIHPVFVPLFQQICFYLSPRFPVNIEPGVEVGMSKDIAIPPSHTIAYIVDPKGNVHSIEGERGIGYNLLHFNDTETPGIYDVFLEKDERDDFKGYYTSFAVNLDPGEGDLESLTHEETGNILNPYFNNLDFLYPDDPLQGTLIRGGLASGGINLGNLFAFLVLLFLGIETFLLRR